MQDFHAHNIENHTSLKISCVKLTIKVNQNDPERPALFHEIETHETWNIIVEGLFDFDM